MNSEMAISVESSINTACAGVTVLLVDGDSTCLTIVSKMLRRLGYEVMTAKRATEAFCIIQERQYEIDLILAEGCLPDMDKYELLETMRKISKLPVVLMSIDSNGKAVLGSLFKGAVLYLVKPIAMDDLKNLWQFAFIKESKNVVAAEEIFGFEEELSLENASDVTVESQPLIGEGGQNYQNEKRERSDDMENNEEDNDDSVALKKPKLIWTNELHNRFLEAIKKYRLSLKREQYAIQKTMSRGSAVEHVVSHHLSSPFSPQEGSVKFENWQSMAVADQPDTNGLIQENLNGHMPIPSLCSAYLLKHANSNCNDELMIKFEQQTPCNKQLDSAHSEFNLTGDRVTVNDGLVGFHQIGNSEQFLKGETDLLNIGDSGLESLLHCPKPFDGSLQEKQQKQLKFLLPEPSQLPPHPQEQEEHDVFGAERGREFNEVYG
ncbi:hypothetical protein SCA6_015239 [Theobroma cacao]